MISSASFGAVGSGPSLGLRAGESFTYSVTGSFDATWILQKSHSHGAAWSDVATAVDTGGSGTITADVDAQYRFICSEYTSGAIVTSMTPTTLKTREVINAQGVTTVREEEDGVTLLVKSLLSGAGCGTASGTGVVATEYGDAYTHTTVLTLTNVAVTSTDHTTNGGSGSLKVYDFPEGLIGYSGGSTNLTIVSDAGGLAANSSLLGSMGSTAAGSDNATLTTTEADFIPSTACTLTSSAGAMKGKATTPAIFDGTGTATDLYLNFAASAGDSSGTDNLTINGTITIRWAALGDN